MNDRVRIGLIGTGFMGKAHALAYRSAPAVFSDLPQVELVSLCDVPGNHAAAMAKQFGFANSTDNWRDLVTDANIDIVSIAAPNNLHRKIAIAALESGKHVLCEKPMATSLEDAIAMANAARLAGTATMVGYNYVHNPALLHARKLIDEGKIGEIIQFCGWADEDYQADGTLPATWRMQRDLAGLGVLGDIGCHLVSVACALLGPIENLVAQTRVIYPVRQDEDGNDVKVDTEDTASALLNFASGAQGSISMSRAAWGRKNRLDWEIHGTLGMLTFSQERMNELRLFDSRGTKPTGGFTTILTSPEHPPYGEFCPAPGHQLGFLDLATIEIAEFLRRVSGKPSRGPDFAAALEIEKVIHGIDQAAQSDKRVTFS